jgi:uncharacterized protein (TIGR02271 family)
VLAERLRIGRRRKELGRVRVKKVTRARPRVVDAPVARDEVVVRRVPVDRFVEAPVPDRYEGETLIVSLMEEVPVVVKRLRVVEELHIARRTVTGRRRARVVLRRQEAIIERRPRGRPALDDRRRP